MNNEYANASPIPVASFTEADTNQKLSLIVNHIAGWSVYKNRTIIYLPGGSFYVKETPDEVELAIQFAAVESQRSQIGMGMALGQQMAEGFNESMGDGYDI